MYDTYSYSYKQHVACVKFVMCMIHTHTHTSISELSNCNFVTIIYHEHASLIHFHSVIYCLEWNLSQNVFHVFTDLLFGTGTIENFHQNL